MFGLGKNERALYERMIVILADQVDWHRNAAGLPMLARPVPVQLGPPGSMTEEQATRMWVSEDEEIVNWQRDNNVLDLDDARAALEQIGAMNTDVSDYMN